MISLIVSISVRVYKTPHLVSIAFMAAFFSAESPLLWPTSLSNRASAPTDGRRAAPRGAGSSGSESELLDCPVAPPFKRVLTAPQ